jgi:glucokinase
VAPGRLAIDEGICLSCDDFPSWRDVQLVEPFAEQFDLPTCLLGSTQAAALGEICFGAARDLSNLLFVRVGAQIDSALVLNGQPLSLPRVNPGQAGHMVIEPDGPACSCGESGCWQALAGRDALVARVLKAIRKGGLTSVSAAADNRVGAITPALIVQMAGDGDAVARRALEETGRYLGIGLANLVALFSPEAVVVDGVPACLGPALLQAAEATLKSSSRAGLLSHCVLLSSELGDMAEVLGAAAWAARRAV